MSAHKHQLQFRARPDGEWTYHSRVDPAEAGKQIEYYASLHGEARIFDYRIVEQDSRSALTAPPPPVFVET